MSRSRSHLTRRVLFVVCGLGSIATLLGHLYGIASMRNLALSVLVPSLVAMLAVWIWSRRLGDREFLVAARAGLIGGLWGTLGYDWCRVPLHLIGQNPFPPIRIYGVWIAGAAHSTARAVGLGRPRAPSVPERTAPSHRTRTILRLARPPPTARRTKYTPAPTSPPPWPRPSHSRT